MDSSSTSASSSSPHYKGASVPFPASSRPMWPDLPIYDSTPHYPPPNYAYDYTGGGSAAEKKEEEEESAMAVAVEREHMFDKVVTPSDVGKLNRLVIPKQHAEKYFPLDSSTGDSKGLLLNFVDRSGKPWRFRYSYWNSSQSYVMTKGWSRFVKDKKLDAGDIVSFHRGADEKDRFYIDWRRRPNAPPYHHHHALYHHGVQFQHGFALHRPMNNIPPPPFYNSNYNLSPPLPPPAREQHWGSVVGYNGLTTSNASTDGGYRGNYGMVSPNFCHHSGSVIYLGAAAAASAASVAPQQQMLGAGGRISDHMMMIGGGGGGDGGAVAQAQQMVFDSVPVVHGGKTVPKRLRLFGVNMDYTDSQEEFEQKQQNHHHLHDFVLDSDQISSSSSGAESELQLRLRSGSAGGVDKGKSSSSMSLDLDI